MEETTVTPLKNAFAVHFVEEPVALVPAAVDPIVYAFALFDSLFKVAYIIAPVTPNFDRFSFLFFALAEIKHFFGLGSDGCFSRALKHGFGNGVG